MDNVNNSDNLLVWDLPLRLFHWGLAVAVIIAVVSVENDRMDVHERAGLTVLGLTIYTGQIGIISLVAVLVFIGSFAMSMGPVVWVMLSEMFPNNVRSVAMSIAVAAQWLFNALVANSFPLVNESALNQTDFNGALPYFIFASFCVIAMIFVWKLVPETKGKTLEEMEALWSVKAGS